MSVSSLSISFLLLPIRSAPDTTAPRPRLPDLLAPAAAEGDARPGRAPAAEPPPAEAEGDAPNLPAPAAPDAGPRAAAAPSPPRRTSPPPPACAAPAEAAPARSAVRAACCPWEPPRRPRR